MTVLNKIEVFGTNQSYESGQNNPRNRGGMYYLKSTKKMAFDMMGSVGPLRQLENAGKVHNKDKDKPKEDDLYCAMRSFLIFGQVLGIVTLEGLGQKNCRELNFRWQSWQTIYNVGMTAFLTLATLINVINCFQVNNKNPSDLAWSANMAVYYAVGAFNYNFFRKRSQRFIELFKKWRELDLDFEFVDKSLFRDSFLISAFIYTFCILEHAFSHLKFFPLVDTAERRLLNEPSIQELLKNASAWETYYWRSHPFLPNLIPFNMPVVLFFFLGTKFAIYAWDFGDILICLISRGLYCKFKLLIQEADTKLVQSRQGSNTEDWIKLATDHEKLCQLVNDFESLLSPLVFVTFGVNIYYLCLQLNLGLTPSANNSAIASVYATWAFLQLLLRIFSAAISASEINSQGHRIIQVLRKCPTQFYSTELERAERFLAMSKIGLTGLGCFTLTRPFILSIISVVFTFEIVLLQSTSTIIA